MSDFFSGLSGGIRMPDAKIGGDGPLPTSLSGPQGINGDPDGKYNFNNSLLDGLQPYSYAGSGSRMGSDRNYQQIPHRVARIVHTLYLPSANAGSSDLLKMSHAVDQGDLVFIIDSERPQALIHDSFAMRDASVYKMFTPNVSTLCNLTTVNYILAGLQRLYRTNATFRDVAKDSWVSLAKDLDFEFHKVTNPDQAKRELLRLIRCRFIPFGIAAGSENQGGKHETGLSPVQAAVNHVTTLTIDGQNRDLVNLWRSVNISAGDDLILRLELCPTKRFTLNHYYKGTVQQHFPGEEWCWQLVADRYSMTHDPSKDLTQRMTKPQPSMNQCVSKQCFDYDYRLDGYWRIGQCMQHRMACDEDVQFFSNDMVFLRGQLLQITFAPVWVDLDCSCNKAFTPSIVQEKTTMEREKPKATSEPTVKKMKCKWDSAQPKNILPAVPNAAPLPTTMSLPPTTAMPMRTATAIPAAPPTTARPAATPSVSMPILPTHPLRTTTLASIDEHQAAEPVQMRQELPPMPDSAPVQVSSVQPQDMETEAGAVEASDVKMATPKVVKQKVRAKTVNKQA